MSLLLAALTVAESVALIYVGYYPFDLNNDGDVSQINTFSFELLFFFGISTTFIVRERRFFWESMPSPYLIFFCCVETGVCFCVLLSTLLCAVIVVVICSVGIAGALAKVPFWNNVIVVLWACFCSFVINDPIKAAYFRYLKV